jgi:hypothetical protein
VENHPAGRREEERSVPERYKLTVKRLKKGNLSIKERMRDHSEVEN